MVRVATLVARWRLLRPPWGLAALRVSGGSLALRAIWRWPAGPFARLHDHHRSCGRQNHFARKRNLASESTALSTASVPRADQKQHLDRRSGALCASLPLTTAPSALTIVLSVPLRGMGRSFLPATVTGAAERRLATDSYNSFSSGSGPFAPPGGGGGGGGGPSPIAGHPLLRTLAGLPFAGLSGLDAGESSDGNIIGRGRRTSAGGAGGGQISMPVEVAAGAARRGRRAKVARRTGRTRRSTGTSADTASSWMSCNHQRSKLEHIHRGHVVACGARACVRCAQSA
jgi:hypothetical protein